MGNTGSICGAEIGSQLAVWGRALLERDRPALGLPGERMLFLGYGGTLAFAPSLSYFGFRNLALVAESLASLCERTGVGETDAAYAS